MAARSPARARYFLLPPRLRGGQGGVLPQAPCRGTYPTPTLPEDGEGVPRTARYFLLPPRLRGGQGGGASTSSVPESPTWPPAASTPKAGRDTSLTNPASPARTAPRSWRGGACRASLPMVNAEYPNSSVRLARDKGSTGSREAVRRSTLRIVSIHEDVRSVGRTGARSRAAPSEGWRS